MSVVKSIGSDKWLVFVVSIPTSNTTLRMRIWRALKGLGCAVLRDGVYLLPAGRGLRQSLRVHAEEVRGGGGNAYLLNVSSSSSEEKHDYQHLFDHSAEYQVLTNKLSTFRRECPTLDAGAARRQLKAIRRELERLAVVDYFPGPLRFDVEDQLAEVETAFLANISSHEKRIPRGSIVTRDRQDYQQRLWVSHTPLSAARMASAWLVKRFIDPAANFAWLEPASACPSSVVGFNFDGAEFSQMGSRVPFEVLLASFGLEADRGLVRIAAIVHWLETGGTPVAEAPGVKRILKGVHRNFTDNDTLLAEANRTFDLLYAAYASPIS